MPSAPAPTAERAPRPSAPVFGGFDAFLGAFSAVVVACIAFAFPACRLRTSPAGLVPLFEATVGLSVLLAFYAWRREARLTAVLRTTIWAIVLSNLCLLPLYLPMRRAIPLADPLLARADHALGFDDGAWVRWATAHPVFERCSTSVYDSLNVLCVLAVIVTSVSGRVARAHVILLAILLGVVVTLGVAYFVPAIGPWASEGFAPTADQLHCGAVIRLLKTDAAYVVDMAHPDPIIATPSWHVILAVLSALALAPIRVIGPVSVLWASLIVLSTLTTGWHYLVDVLTGVAVAVLCHVAAAHLIGRSRGGAP